jgi:hypothetical protein
MAGALARPDGARETRSTDEAPAARLDNARMTNFGPPPDGQGPGYNGFPPQGPFLMPAGLPPGAEYTHEERTPEGVTYYRIYAGIMAVLNAILALVGLVLMFTPLFAAPKATSDAEMVIMGLIYGGIGTVFFIAWVVTLFSGRKPWVHTMGTVMIALGMTQICCLPVLIPLLINWLKPETKRWYGAT